MKKKIGIDGFSATKPEMKVSGFFYAFSFGFLAPFDLINKYFDFLHCNTGIDAKFSKGYIGMLVFFIKM
jgi:hypothetical protein